MVTGSELQKLTNALHRESTVKGDSAYMEQYKLCIEMADKISERREHANSFFLTINTGVCGFVGYLFSKDAEPELKKFVWFVPVAGILLSYFWYRMIRSYRDLNTAKFNVIHLIEQKLPLAPYATEWLALGEGKDRKKYWPFSHLEMGVPIAFICMYVVLLLNIIPWSKKEPADKAPVKVIIEGTDNLPSDLPTQEAPSKVPADSPKGPQARQ